MYFISCHPSQLIGSVDTAEVSAAVDRRKTNSGTNSRAKIKNNSENKRLNTRTPTNEKHPIHTQPLHRRPLMLFPLIFRPSNPSKSLPPFPNSFKSSLSSNPPFVSSWKLCSEIVDKCNLSSGIDWPWMGEYLCSIWGRLRFSLQGLGRNNSPYAWARSGRKEKTSRTRSLS